jgi:lipopolysaccharide transport system ATP-binding protein
MIKNDVMSDEVLVKVNGVSKKFCKSLKHSMLYGISDIARDVFAFGPSSNVGLRRHEFWAVDGVSFDVRRGECLGIIGRNGAGKSTLLKMISGIMLPDKGIIEVQGRVGAVIELGAGFHPMLTGRENIYINGSVLGLTKKEIDAKFESIVDFAELETFIDTPVKFYSSGMRVRLGFAVAAHLNPDVLLIDEVLAVGDIGFRAKCFNLITKISKNAAVVFISHQMPQVVRMCTDLILLDQGKAHWWGSNVIEGIEKYYTSIEAQHAVTTGSGEAELLEVEFESNGRTGVESINYLDDLTIKMKLKVEKSIDDPMVYVTFIDQSMNGVAHCNTKVDKYTLRNKSDLFRLRLDLPKINLNPGIYFVSIGVQTTRPFRVLKQYYAYKKIQINGDFVGITPVQLKGKWLAT